MKINKPNINWKRVSYRVLLGTVLSLPVIIFCFKFAITYRNGVLPSDWNYFTQMYEAARKSIVEYHQFPWWNAWSLGGVPLYANPQFGLISIQMPLVILFGTVKGLHFAVIVYMLLGFWGMFTLLKRVGAVGLTIPSLLSYIWVFSAFPILHLSVGHLTFATYFLVPWFVVALVNVYNKRGWLWLALMTAFLLNQAPHYIAIHMLMIGSLIAIFLIYKSFNEHRGLVRSILPFIWAGCVGVILVAHKLFFTLQYLHEYPRLVPTEPSVSTNVISAALTFRHPIVNAAATFGVPYGWHEYGAYFGILTLGLTAYMIFKLLIDSKKANTQQSLILLGMVGAILIAMGSFSVLAPYSIMHHLPLLSQMQVSTRWLGWFVFGAIVFLARLPRNKTVYIVLGLSALDVFLATYPILNAKQQIYNPPQHTVSSFEQHNLFQDIQLPQRTLYATQSNAGEMYGYEPILGVFQYANANDYYTNESLTNECGIEHGCSFVMSHNASVIKWSPNKISLKRINSAQIVLDINSGKNWCVNGKSLYPTQKIFEMKQRLIIDDPADYITVDLKPQGC